MKIKSLVIDGIGGIKHLELSFNDHINVICGANGIGKTTILDTISDPFCLGRASHLKRNATCKQGKYSITIEVSDGTTKKNVSAEENVDSFSPNEIGYRTHLYKYARHLLSFGINRDINYVQLNSVAPDPQRQDTDVASQAVNGIKANDIKNWFVNRYLFSEKKDSITNEQMANYRLAESVFSILDDTIQFKTVNASTFDIILETSKGNIYFEYLSSGYKSCIYVIFGIIKEIEYRTVGKPIMVQDFDGVILIDEIDLHLHPVWQSELIKALKAIFPCAQFILTTHSPSILQSLERDEIIALGYNESGDTFLKELNLGRFGLQGWTLEEILKDIMEMPSTSSQLYQDTLKSFDEAMNNEDKDLILQQYVLLKEMLHPNNPLRKLLSIQVAEWED